ncbi:MAG TPA: glycosyltransferase family 25 protein [Burkholderiaceae bacterium]|nr:glycosyltransferase family 25 protein [Burkholderiaceae bacterium]
MQCFVINMTKDTARREQIERQLRSIGLQYEIFPAVNGRALSNDEMARCYDPVRAARTKRPMSAGEVGCALSHQGVYRWIVERGLAGALVLEDDAQLDPGIQAVLTALEPLLATEKPLVVLLSHVKLTSYWGTRSLVGRYVLAPALNETYGAHGYVLNRAAAAALLKHLSPVRLPADFWDQFRREDLVQVRAVVPYCIGLTAAAKQTTMGADTASLNWAAQAAEEAGWRYLLHRYVYRKFIYQLFVRPFIRRQAMTW